LVHTQRNRIKLKEMEITALAGMRKENADPLHGLITSYRNMLFPGSNKEKDAGAEDMERRKAALAKEAQQAFIVKPVDIKKVMKRSSENPEYAKLAGAAIAQHEKGRIKDLRKKARLEADQKRKLLRSRSRK
tara:strand:+ start:461 stop:856 length:396 start_codon:yes stop_codon:yes gene_type:complete